MTPLPPAHLVGTGGAIGAVLRHLVAQRVDADSFPVATFLVNVVGSFVLALVTFGALDGGAALLVGVGACGSFTTYSSFSYETVRLYESGDRARAALNAVGTLVACLLAVQAGAWLVG